MGIGVLDKRPNLCYTVGMSIFKLPRTALDALLLDAACTSVAAAFYLLWTAF